MWRCPYVRFKGVGVCRWLMHDDMLGFVILWESWPKIQAVRAKSGLSGTKSESGCPGHMSGLSGGQSPGRPGWGDQNARFLGDQNDTLTVWCVCCASDGVWLRHAAALLWMHPRICALMKFASRHRSL